MISVLIMDDNEVKIEDLRRLLIEECFVKDECIHVAKNVHEGRVLLRQQVYDLLLLDLVLPERKDTDAREDVGASFVDELFSTSPMKMPIHIIGLTQFDETLGNLTARFENKLWYLIKYDENDITWKNRIRSKVNQIQETKRQIEESIINRNKYDIGIICALQEEFMMLQLAFKECSWERKRITGFSQDVYTTTLLSAYGNDYQICAICPNVPCCVPTSTLATEMMTILKIDYLFMTGITAGIKSSGLQLGDIVVSRSVQDYSAGKIVEGKEKEFELLKEINVILANTDMTSRASKLAGDRDQMNALNNFIFSEIKEDVHISATLAPTVSGPYVVASSQMVEYIKENSDRKLSALDMEGYGLYYASHELQKKCLWIKGITDFADSHKGDSKHKLASLASGRFLYLLIKEYM